MIHSKQNHTSNHFVDKVRDALLRGGRMTKYKGQAASYAPSFAGVMAVALMTAAPIALTGTGAMAGTCTESAPGSFGVWTCSGSAAGGGADPAIVISQNLGAGTLIVTEDGTFGLDTSILNITALNIIAGVGSTGGLDVNLGAANITSQLGSIRVDNQGLDGDTRFISTGTLTSGPAGGAGVLVGSFRNVNGGDVYASVNNVTHTTPGRAAFQVIQQGAGSITAITQAGGTIDGSLTQNAIEVYNQATSTDITVTTNGVVMGGGNALYVLNRAAVSAGATIITTNDTLTGGTFNGIWANNVGVMTTTLNVTANGDVSGNFGINTRHMGTGATTITTAGNVTGIGGAGMYIYHNAAGAATDMTIITGGDVTGASHGLVAYNNGTGTGATTVTTGYGTTVQGGSGGITAKNVTAIKTNLSVRAYSTVTGLAAHGIYAGNAGTGYTEVTTGAGAITGTGATSDGIIARNTVAATGAMTITTGTGAITGGDDGIDASNYGTAGLTITVGGDVTGGAGHGINAYNSANDVTASMVINQAFGTTTMGAIDGINANNLGGSLTIKALGTSIGTANDGIHAVNNVAGTTTSTITAYNATGGVNGIYASNNPTGLQSITVTGTVTGGTGYGIATYTTLGGMTNITLNAGAAVSSTAGLGIYNDAGDSTTTVNTGAAVSGDIVLSDGSDNLVFAGGDFSGVTLFDGGDDIDTADGFTDVLTFAGSSGALVGANVTNWESVVIDAGSTISFSDALLTVGTLTTTGTGILDASGSALAITGNLTNNGTVTMLDGAAGDTVTVSGDYTGAGMLLVDVDFTGDMSDQLVVNGNVTPGPTLIAVTDITTGTASGNDVLVVDVTGGTTNPGDFALASGPITNGAFDYDLELTGVQWFLAGAINATGAVYEAAPAALLGFTNLPTLEQRVGQRQQLPGQAAWVRLHGEGLDTAPASSTAGNTSVDSNTWGLQAGVDFPLDSTGDGDWVLGVTAQYGSINTSVANALGTGSIKAEGYGLGATATWYGNNAVYVDMQAQMNWLDSDISSSSAGSLVTGQSSTAYALSVEVGQRFAMNNGGTLVPQAQLTWGQVDGGSFTDTAGNLVDLGTNSRTIGRLGLAYEFANEAEGQKFYVIGNVLHDFSGASSVDVAGTVLSAQGEETWAEIGLGGSYNVSDTTMLYGEAAYKVAPSSSGNNGLSATAGLRIQW